LTKGFIFLECWTWDGLPDHHLRGPHLLLHVLAFGDDQAPGGNLEKKLFFFVNDKEAFLPMDFLPF
jgi:hypothetical protein